MQHDLANKCVDDLRTVVQSLAQMENKTVLNVYDQDELLDATVGVKFPACGVIYEGIRGGTKSAKESHVVGSDAELICSVVLLYRDESLGKTDARNRALHDLDHIRRILFDRRSPSGHFWRFEVEAAAARKNGTVMWVQRWATPVIVSR